MLAFHQYRVARRVFLESGSDAFHAVRTIKRFRLTVHYIAPIIQHLCRKRMNGLRPPSPLLRIGDAACRKQTFHAPAPQVGKFGRRDKPVFRKADAYLFRHERRIAQLAQLGFQVLGLRSAGNFLFPSSTTLTRIPSSSVKVRVKPKLFSSNRMSTAIFRSADFFCIARSKAWSKLR